MNRSTVAPRTPGHRTRDCQDQGARRNEFSLPRAACLPRPSPLLLLLPPGNHSPPLPPVQDRVPLIQNGVETFLLLVGEGLEAIGRFQHRHRNAFVVPLEWPTPMHDRISTHGPFPSLLDDPNWCEVSSALSSLLPDLGSNERHVLPQIHHAALHRSLLLSSRSSSPGISMSSTSSSSAGRHSMTVSNS